MVFVPKPSKIRKCNRTMRLVRIRKYDRNLSGLYQSALEGHGEPAELESDLLLGYNKMLMDIKDRVKIVTLSAVE